MGVILMREVLQVLRDGRFHSGEALGAVLGVSRAAVWKRLEHLEAELGLEMHRVRGRGYKLASPCESRSSSSSYPQTPIRTSGWGFGLSGILEIHRHARVSMRLQGACMKPRH